MNLLNLKQKYSLGIFFVILVIIIIFGINFLKKNNTETFVSNEISNVNIDNNVELNSVTQSSSFKFGMNAVFNFDPVIKKIIADPTKYSLYAPLFAEYHIDHLRYPGGIPVRYYFWNNINLIKNATDAISRYYYAQGTKAGDENGKNYARFNFSLDPNNYSQFLNFTKTAGIKPIIQLNTLFYVYNNNIYQTESFQKNFDAFPLEADRWTKIANYLNAQIDYTHNIFPESLIWEIGNEDNAIFDATEYGIIVSKYTDIIKAKYPNDKVIVAMSAGEIKSERKAQWNKDLINYLDKNNALSKIDYFAPHYYIGATFMSQAQADINKRIKSEDFKKFFDDMKSNFPSTYTPKFSVTEFSELLHSDDNINYNTQLNAMLMWDELLKFHSDSSIKSVSRLGFTADKNAIFFDKTTSKNFSYVDQSRQDSNIFTYIPPETDAVKIFFDGTGDTILDFSVTDDYELLVTKTNSTKYLQVLNYNDTVKTIDISSYGSGTYTTYTLPVLTTYYWDIEANKTTGNATGLVTLPAHSFTTIIIVK